MINLSVEGVKASERAIKRLEKIQRGKGRYSSALNDKRYQEQVSQALTVNYQTLDNHAYLLEATLTTDQGPDVDVDVLTELGKNASDLYHQGKYVIFGRGVEFIPLVTICHKDL
jgi:hypothetical protein